MQKFSCNYPKTSVVFPRSSSLQVERTIALFNHTKNSVLCRLFCAFLNSSSLYDYCMLAVFHGKAVTDVLNSFSSSLR